MNATQEQLLDALRRADAAGDAAAAQAIARRLDAMRADGYVRPEVDPASENLDPRDVQARRRPGPATTFRGKLKEVYNVAGGVGSLADAVRGLRDIPEGVAQLGVRGARLVGLADDNDVRAVDRFVERSNAQYEFDTARQPGQGSVARAATNATVGIAATPARLLQGANWVTRAAGAGTAGAIGGAVQPVTSQGERADGGLGTYGEQKAWQVGAGGVVGAAAAPVSEVVIRAAVPAVNAVAGYIRNLRSAPTPIQIDNLIAQELSANGVRWSTLGPEVREALRQDVRQALSVGDNVQGDALRRLADIRSVGATPTRGAITLDPVQITTERNLAKVGANSTDPQLQELAQIESANNRALIERINALGASRAGGEFETGQRLVGSLRGLDEQIGTRVTGLYNDARALGGGEIALDGVGFVNNASRALDQAFKGGFLPEQFQTILRNIAEGKMPMNIATQEQLRTMLATAQRSAQDGNVRTALGIVRNALEGIQPVQSASRAVGPAIPGGQAPTATADAVTEAFNRARGAHRARMQLREETPALAAAVDDAQPDSFFRDFVLGGRATARDLSALRQVLETDIPTREMVRAQVIDHLKRTALSGASDEVGTFSQSAFNKELNRIGEQKLRAIGFSDDEIASLKQVGRAASYLQVQPKGSAVNNSNTASAAIGTLDRILSRVPIAGEFIRNPLNSFASAAQARNALRASLPVTGEFVDEATRNALLRSTGGLGIGLGLGAANY